MDDKRLNNIWSHLTEEKLTSSDFDTWKKNFTESETIQENIHSHLTSRQLTSSDINTWKKNLGFFLPQDKEDLVSNTKEVTITSASDEVQAPQLSASSNSSEPLPDAFEFPTTVTPGIVPTKEKEGIVSDEDLERIKQETVISFKDKEGNIVGERKGGLTDREGKYYQDKNISEFGRGLMKDDRDVEDIEADQKKSELKQKVEDVDKSIYDINLEMSGLLNQRIGKEVVKLKPKQLKGQEKLDYEKLLKRKEQSKKDLIQAKKDFTDYKPKGYEEVRIYDISTGKYVDGLNQVSDEGKKLLEERDEKINKYQGSDLESLKEFKNESYYRLLNIAKRVKDGKNAVADDRYTLQKIAEGMESLIPLGGVQQSSFVDVVEMFPDPEDKQFKEGFPNYTIKSSHPLAQEYNAALNDFYALNTAVDLNRNQALSGSEYDNSWKSGAQFVEGFGQMFYGPGAGFDSYKTSVKKPFVDAIQNIGLEGEEVAKMEEAIETTWGEETATIGGNIAGMVTQMAGPNKLLALTKIPKLLQAGNVLTKAKYGKWAAAPYSILQHGGTEAGKFYLTGKMYNNEEYYDPELGFAFGALTPVAQAGSVLLSKVPGAQIIDATLTNAMPNIYKGGKYIGSKSAQATGGVGIAYGAEIADKVVAKGHELGESWDEVIYGKTEANPEGVDPIRKASTLWAVMFASGLAQKPQNKPLHDQLTKDLVDAKYKEVNSKVLEKAEQIEKSGTKEEKSELKKARENADFNVQLKGIKTQIEEIQRSESEAANQTDALKSIMDQVIKRPKKPPGEPGGAGDVVLSKDQLSALDKAGPIQLKNMELIIKKSVKGGSITPEQGQSVINEITNVKNISRKINVENTNKSSAIEELYLEKQKLESELPSESNIINGGKETAKAEANKKRIEEIDGEIKKIAETPESTTDLLTDLIGNPKRQEQTIRNEQWRKENPELVKEIANKTDLINGEGKTIDKALEELSKEYKEPKTEEITVEDKSVVTPETFEVKSKEGEGSKTIEVIKNEDGSRSISQKVDGKEVSSDNIPKENTVDTQKYIEGTFGEILPKAKETTEVKKDVQPVQPLKTKKPVSKKPIGIEAIEKFDKLKSEGVSTENIVRELTKGNYSERVIKKTLDNAGIEYSSRLKTQVELSKLKDQLTTEGRGAEKGLELNKETVDRIAKVVDRVAKEVKNIDQKFSIKAKEAKQLLKGSARKDLTIDKADEIVKDMTKALEKIGQESLIKGINKTIKDSKSKDKSKKEIKFSPESQKALDVVRDMIEGVDLNKATYEQVKNISEYVKEIKTKGKADKALTDKVLRAEKSIVEGTSLESLYKDAKSTELKTKEEVEKFLNKETFVLLDGKRVDADFIKDNPGTDYTNAKGYEKLSVTTVNNLIGTKENKTNKQGILSKQYWLGGLIKKIGGLNPLKATANVETILGRLKKGESNEFKKQIDDISTSLTREADYQVEQRQEQSKKKTDKIFKDSFGSTSKGNRLLNKIVPKEIFKRQKGLTEKESIGVKATNGVAVDIYITGEVFKRRAEKLRQEAKNKNQKKKETAEKKANDLDNILETSGVNEKVLKDYIESNKQLKDFADKTLEFYKEMGDSFEQTAIDATGKPFLNPDYYPIYRESAKEEKTQTVEERSDAGEFAQRSAMVDRLKDADPYLSDNLDINTDVRDKMKDYVDQMSHAESYIPISQKINQVINAATKGKIIKKIGKENYENLMDNLDAIIDVNYNKSHDQMKFLQKINRLGVVITLAAKPANLIKQITSATHWGYAGLKDGITTAEVWSPLAEIPFNKEYRKVAYDVVTSPYVRNRIRKSDIDPVLKKDLLDIRNQPLEAAWRRIEQLAMSPITLGDIGGVLGGGVPYSVAKYKKIKTTPKGEFDVKAFEEAYKRFREESSTAQQSGKAFTTGKQQRTAIGKLLTTYKTSQTQALNKTMQGWLEMTDKTNTTAQRRKGFFKWQKFMRASLLFQAVGTGAAYSYIFGGADEEDMIEQQLFDTTVETMNANFQGMGAAGYVPMLVTNFLGGKNMEWNLPPVVAKTSEALQGIEKYASILNKDYDELTDTEKEQYDKMFVNKNIDKIIKSLDPSNEDQDFVKLLFSGKDKNYRNPLYEMLIKGEDFKRDKYIKIKVTPKEKDKEDKSDGEFKKVRPQFGSSGGFKKVTPQIGSTGFEKITPGS